MNTYSSSYFLAVSPWAAEEKVAIAIHSVSGSDDPVDIEWPFQVGIQVGNFNGVDLQGRACGSSTRKDTRCAGREVHRTQRGCR